MVLSLGKRRVSIFGLSFKAGTDDLRESPLVEFAERLIGKGCEVRIYDANVSLSRLLGSNKAHIEERLPHLVDLLTDDVDAVVSHGEVLVVGTRDEAVLSAVDRAPEGTVVLDLVRLPGADERRRSNGYVGISW